MACWYKRPIFWLLTSIIVSHPLSRHFGFQLLYMSFTVPKIRQEQDSMGVRRKEEIHCLLRQMVQERLTKRSKWSRVSHAERFCREERTVKSRNCEQAYCSHFWIPSRVQGDHFKAIRPPGRDVAITFLPSGQLVPGPSWPNPMLYSETNQQQKP